MRLAQYFAGIFHNMLPNISRPSLRNISLHEPSLYNARPRYLDKRPSN